jgi:hypothetical protein
MTATLLARIPGAATTLPPEVDLRRQERPHRTTGVRRLLAVLGTAVALIFGTVLPASAGFADKEAITLTAGTVTVAAPGNVVGKLTCGSTSSTMNVTWTASTSSRVSGYRITVHFSDGYKQHTDVDASATSWTAPIPTYNVTAFSIRYTVTTYTEYGWEKETENTGRFQC